LAGIRAHNRWLADFCGCSPERRAGIGQIFLNNVDDAIPMNAHGGTGVPDYGKYAVADLLYVNEAHFCSQRPFVQIMLSGVFERFPNLETLPDNPNEALLKAR